MKPSTSVVQVAGHRLQATSFGDAFVLLKTSDRVVSLPEIGDAILSAQLGFIADIIATDAEICLKLRQPFDDFCRQKLAAVSIVGRTASREFTLPIWFHDSDDWPIVQRSTGLTRDEYLRAILSTEFVVAMFGFLPGFVYLNGLPERLHVERKANPCLRTEAGDFAVGGTYAGVYSLPSPAGWNVIGKIGARLLIPDQVPPMIIVPGDRIKLAAISESNYRARREFDFSVEA